MQVKTNQRLNNTGSSWKKPGNNLELRVGERTEDLKRTTERLQESEKRFSIFMANLHAGCLSKTMQEILFMQTNISLKYS